MDIRKEKDRNPWIYQLCVLSIGIPVRNPGGGEEEQPADQKEAINPEPTPVEITYYPNSIEEYRYYLFLGNRRGSRTGLSKKKKSAESGIKFLQYAKSQELFMEFLMKYDETTYRRVIVYSDPSILKKPFGDRKVLANDRIPANQSIKSK